MQLPSLSEDSIYRTSTQFCKWSFSSSSLATVRETTNVEASRRVRSLINDDIDVLTVEEELLLIHHFSNKVIQLAKHLRIPTEVAATAVQFLRRFYVVSSCMDYHPQQICTSALFLATKTDNHNISLREFADKCGRAQDTIVAPEFRLMQGLQFAFDVRHPHRGLEAAMMLLEDISQGLYVSPSKQKASLLQSQLDEIVGGSKGKAERFANLHSKAREYLRGGALLTDAYFLYTPSQIWLAALLAADSEIARFYLRCALGSIDPAARDQIVAAIESCTQLITTYSPVDEEERKRVMKKLRQCSNPETTDLVKLNAAQKREASEAGGNAAKKLKVDNGVASKLDLFGPAINR